MSYQPPLYSQPQPGGYPQPQPGGYPQPQPGGYPQPQPGGYPPPQQGGYQPQPGGYSAVIVQQPTLPVGALPNCPPGLECLADVDHILIKQKVEMLEAITTFETNNRYEIKNALGQQMFYAKEDTDCCTRNCCGAKRPFDMKIYDNFKTEVMHLNRPLACDSCFFPCCLQSIEVSSPPGTVIGYVEQDWSILKPKFSIKDASGNKVLSIKGPFCTCTLCCGSVEFQVISIDGSTQVGKVSKDWAGFLREVFTDTDIFGITFPVDLDIKIKGVIMGAAFLIDFMFFEQHGKNQNDGIGMIS